MKKKDIMVRYTLVPNSDDGAPPRCVKCMTLSKSKIITFAVIGIVALVILSLSLVHSNNWSFKDLRNATDCLFGDGMDPTCGSKMGKTRGREKSLHTPTGRRRCSKQGKCADGTHIRHHLGVYKKRLPNALIIGARKAGTRALLRFVNLHREIVTSRKETHFFDRFYDKGFDWYLSQMPDSYPHQVTLEKTPNYFVDWDVPELVYAFNSSIKLMLILRNPVDRAISDYLQLKLKDKNPDRYPSFEQLAVDQTTGEINKSYAPIKRSLYCRHLEKWLVFFDLSQILIIDGENIKRHPWEELTRVETFLGVSHEIDKERFIFNSTKGFYCVKMLKRSTYGSSPDDVVPYEAKCLAPTKGREHPKLKNGVREKLLEFFKPFNKRLFSKIGKTYKWD